MEDARALIRTGAVHGALIVAGFQTRGRGRTPERRWVSAPGRNLLFNLLLAADALATDAPTTNTLAADADTADALVADASGAAALAADVAGAVVSAAALIGDARAADARAADARAADARAADAHGGDARAGASGDAAPTVARLPLLCGLAVAHAVEQVSGVACQVKWPNDVIMGGCKVAGCLCAATAGWYSIGVGVTCNQLRGLPAGRPASRRPDADHAEFSAPPPGPPLGAHGDLPTGAAPGWVAGSAAGVAPGPLPASSVRLQCGRRVLRRQLLEQLLAELERLLREPHWAAAVDRRLFGRGRWAHVRGAGRSVPAWARIERVAADGGLVVRDAAGALHTCTAGSVEPAESPELAGPGTRAVPRGVENG